jgi:hypothetical protein
MDQQGDLARAGRGLDAIGAVDEVARPRFHPEAIECRLAECRLGPLAKIGGNADIIGLEGALERGLELALGVGSVELGPADTDPCAPARRTSANVGRDIAIGTERKPDQFLSRGSPSREDASALRYMRF